jgi:hypothetical protein
LIGSSSDATGRLAGWKTGGKADAHGAAQAPRRHSRLPPPRPLSRTLSVPTCPVTGGLQHITDILHTVKLEPRTYELIPPIPIYPSSFPLLSITTQHIHHSLLFFSACSTHHIPHCLPAIPSRSLSLSAYPCPTTHPVTRFVRDSPRPRYPYSPTIHHEHRIASSSLSHPISFSVA